MELHLLRGRTQLQTLQSQPKWALVFLWPCWWSLRMKGVRPTQRHWLQAKQPAVPLAKLKPECSWLKTPLPLLWSCTMASDWSTCKCKVPPQADSPQKGLMLSLRMVRCKKTLNRHVEDTQITGFFSPTNSAFLVSCRHLSPSCCKECPEDDVA